MDLWVVAVAAGAGYLGKYLQNLSLSEKERLLVSSSSTISTQTSSDSWSFLRQIRDGTSPRRRLAQEKGHKEVFSELNHIFGINQFGGDADSVFERASTSDQVRMVEDFNAQWLKSSPKFSAKESFQHNMEPHCRFCSTKLHKSRSSRGTNLERVEEYAYVSAAAPPAPLLSTDHGNETNERSNRSSFDLWSRMGEEPLRRRRFSCNSFDAREETLRIFGCKTYDSWSNVGEGTSRRNSCSDERCTCFCTSSKFPELVTGSQDRRIDGAFDHSPGQSNDKLLFFIGLTIGILPTAAANKREVQKMNEKLEHAMTLVQDLKEELDMKDNLTVKELGYDGSQALSTKTPSLLNQELSLSSSDQDPKNVHTTRSARELADCEQSENFQSMSRIEAELEAELERLQLNMDLERTSNFVELDTQSGGGMKPDDSDSESEVDERSDSMIRRVETPANYAVSPRELTIRLHEVIESQLEARITELETALQINKNRSHSLELESQGETSLSLKYNGESPEDAMDIMEDDWGEMSGNS